MLRNNLEGGDKKKLLRLMWDGENDVVTINLNIKNVLPREKLIQKWQRCLIPWVWYV